MPRRTKGITRTSGIIAGKDGKRTGESELKREKAGKDVSFTPAQTKLMVKGSGWVVGRGSDWECGSSRKQAG